MGDEAETIIRTLVQLSAVRQGRTAVWTACPALIDALIKVSFDSRSGHSNISVGETERGWEYSGVIESELKRGADRPFHLLLTT